MDREAMVKEMCEYLLAYNKSLDHPHGRTDWGSFHAAVLIARALHPEAKSEDHPDA